MNHREKLEKIIRSVGMSLRPEFYSGRGATTCDLNHQHLEGIWSGIKEQIGEAEAESFVQLVRKIKVMSATTFLQELYALCDNNWQLDEDREDALGIAIQKDADGDYMTSHGLATLGAGLFSNGRDQTQEIKAWFLTCRGIPPLREEIDRYNNITKIW
jgi:hypothetical protein